MKEELNKKLFEAVKNDDAFEVNNLIELGADVNVKDENGYYTPLHLVAEEGLVNLVKLLLQHGVDVNIKNKYEQTPLHMVCGEEIAELLLQYGADANSKDVFGNTPLHYAGKKAKKAEVLIKFGADVNAKNKEGKTPLFFAEKPEVVEMLIQHGADINTKNNKGETPLHYVWPKQVVELLIKYGADVNAKDEDDNTPLHRAFNNVNTDKVWVLWSKRADIDAVNIYGETPIDIAERRYNSAKIDDIDKQNLYDLISYLKAMKKARQKAKQKEDSTNNNQWFYIIVVVFLAVLWFMYRY